MPAKSASTKAPAQGKPYTLEQCHALVKMFLAQDKKKESRAKADFEWFNQTYCNGERVTSMIYRSAQRIFRKHKSAVKKQLKKEKQERARQGVEGDESEELSSEASSEHSSDEDDDVNNSNNNTDDDADQAVYDSDLDVDLAADEANESGDDDAVSAGQASASSPSPDQMPSVLTFSTIDEDAFLNTTINFALPSTGPSAQANAYYPHRILLLPRGARQLSHANFIDKCLFRILMDIENEKEPAIQERRLGQYANLIEKIESIRGSSYKILAHEFEREFEREAGFAIALSDEQSTEDSESAEHSESDA